MNLRPGAVFAPRYPRGILAAALFAAASATIHAAAFLQIDPDPRTSFGVGPTFAVGTQFTMGDTSYQLESISVALQLSFPGTDLFELGIYADDNGQPGSTAVALGQVSVSSQTLQFQTAPASGLLQAGGVYWVTARVLDGETRYQVGYNTDVSISTGATPSRNTVFVTDISDPASWTDTFLSNIETANLAYSLNGVAVPELSETGFVLGLGALGAAVWLRRRRGS